MKALWAACRAKRFDAAQISQKEPVVVYTIIAESKNQRLLGDRFTADTVCEALDRVQHIRSRGFQVKIAGPDGKPVSENDLEAEAAGIRSLTAGLARSTGSRSS
jgi:hypothetical protein